MRKFFRMIDNMRLPSRWHLSAPVGLEPWEFFKATSLGHVGKIDIAISVPGESLDFTLAGFDVPVVSGKLSRILRSICGDSVQLIPALIEGDSEYFVLNALRSFSCLDENASVFTKWKSGDGRPDKDGDYRMVTKLRIKPEDIPNDVHIFRIRGWPIPLIVSEAIVEAACIMDESGPDFDPL